MKFQITTRHYDLKPNFKAFTEERLLKLKRYFDHIIDVNVILNAEKNTNEVEIKIHVGGRDLLATGQGAEMGAALDVAADKMETQLKRYKGKITARKGRTGLGEAMAANVNAGGGSDEVEDDAQDADGFEGAEARDLEIED